MFEPVLNNPWVQAIAALMALIVVGVLIYLLSPVLVPLFFAFLVAYILDPIVDLFEARRVPRSISIAGLAAIGIALLLAIPLFFIPSLIQQADRLTVAAQEDDSESGSALSIWFYEVVYHLPLEEILDSIDPPELKENGETGEKTDSEKSEESQDQVVGSDNSQTDGTEEEETVEAERPELSDAARHGDDQLDRLTQLLAERVKHGAVGFLRSHGSQIASAGKSSGMGFVQFLTAVGRGALGMLFFIGNLALFSFVAAYLLKDYDEIIATAKGLVPLGCREKVLELSAKIDGQLRGFLRGQMMVCAALGVMYFIGLSLSGVPFAFLIAAFGGIASFVPYLGIALTIGPAVILCIVQQGGIDGNLLGVIMTFVIAQMVEGTLLTPKIVGNQVGLSPVWVILAILVFGNALGFLGVLLAVPIAASLKVLIAEGIAYYRSSEVFMGNDSA